MYNYMIVTYVHIYVYICINLLFLNVSLTILKYIRKVLALVGGITRSRRKGFGTSCSITRQIQTTNYKYVSKPSRIHYAEKLNALLKMLSVYLLKLGTLA